MKRFLCQATDGRWYYTERTGCGFRHIYLENQNEISSREDAKKIMDRMVRRAQRKAAA